MVSRDLGHLGACSRLGLASIESAALLVYDQKDDFGVLRKATMSKLKRFAKALGDPSLYNAPFPLGSLREVWKH
jgi:hypothetical protein